MPVQAQQATIPGASNPDVERIYRDWNDALSKNDAAALLKPYAPDATLESPLVPSSFRHRGRDLPWREELEKLFEILATRKPKVRQFYRTGYFTDGRKIMWEYPQQTRDGQQMEFVEIMEIENGLIRRHRVYWGWYGVRTLTTGSHRR